MEKFKINLDRPEPDKGKIQAKKDFNSFYSTNFPKASLFHSKWFWGVSGIATVALVVTVSLSSFSKNSESTNVLAKSESISSIEVLSSAPAEDLFVSSNESVVVQENATVIEVDGQKEKSNNELIPISKNEEESTEILDHEMVEMTKSENVLFELEFDPLDFPNLEVGNNLFSIDETESVSGDILFEEEWDGVELATINGALNLILEKNGERFSYRVNQSKK